MTDLFLQRVELSNFRVYGQRYVFDFDPAPGVTLIVGANGLGKTTLFDGVEWALTGQVSRLSETPVDGRRRERNPLTRLGQTEGSHRVGVTFSDGSPIDRGQGYEPSEADVAELLRRPGWSEIGDLHRYLLITHFLGQSPAMRFAGRKPKDQWEALKGPAGVDRINFAKERLGGQAARQAFTRVIREATSDLRGATADLTEWEELLAERHRLTQLSRSDEAVSPAMLIESANALAARLVALDPATNWTEAGAHEAPEGLLSRLGSACGLAIARAQTQQASLRALDVRVADYVDIIAEIGAQEHLVATAERQTLEGGVPLREAETAVVLAQEAVATGQKRVAESQAQVGLLTRARVAAGQLADAQARVAESDATLATSRALVEAARVKRAEILTQITGVEARLAQRRRLLQQLADAGVRLDLTEQWRTVHTEIARLEALAAGTDGEDLRARRQSLIAEQTAATDAIRNLGAELKRLDDRASAIAEAVAAIAHRLEPEDTDCPVCATPFAPGDLIKRAQDRSIGRTTSAFALANRLAAAEVERARIARDLKVLDDVLADHILVQTQITQQRGQEQEIGQRLAELGDVWTTAPDPDAVRTIIAGLDAEFRAIEDAAQAEPPLDTLRNQEQTAAATIAAESARGAELTRRQADYLAAMETAQTILRQMPDVWTAERGVVADLEGSRIAAAALADEAAAALETLQADLVQQRQVLAALRESAAAAQAAAQAATLRLDQALQRRATLARAWGAAGLTGDPDRTRLSNQLGLTADRLDSLTRLSERHQRLSDGYRRWTDDQTLRNLERRIAERAGEAGDAGTVSSTLQRRIEAMRSRLDQAEAARSRMDGVVSAMQQRADGYAEHVLQPLNDTIRRFSRTLMTWSDAAITYRAEHLATRAELRTSAVRTEIDGTVSPLDINPNHFFSEGQLSALSVSALLAASTSFRWSRWRGLLMDDPLQHNDVIHASAFMDLMGQLVRRLSYQVIISTHDSAEAEFLISKCRSAGVPLTVHTLAPPSEEGLVSAA